MDYQTRMVTAAKEVARIAQEMVSQRQTVSCLLVVWEKEEGNGSDRKYLHSYLICVASEVEHYLKGGC